MPYDPLANQEDLGHQCFRQDAQQWYVRGGQYLDAYAIMFSGYFPRQWNQDLQGYPNAWATVIIWTGLDKSKTPPVLRAYFMSYTDREDWAQTDGIDPDLPPQLWRSWLGLGTSSFSDHANGNFVYYDLVDWDQMDPAVKNTLNTVDWGQEGEIKKFSQYCPFNDINFQNNLKLTYIQDPNTVISDPDCDLHPELCNGGTSIYDPCADDPYACTGGTSYDPCDLDPQSCYGGTTPVDPCDIDASLCPGGSGASP